MAKILDIVTHPTPSLNEISKKIVLSKLKDKDFIVLVEDMKLTMIKKDGVGLAAPQIGENIRMIVINTKDGKLCMINPEITKKSWRTEVDEEGCLSLPNIFCNIRRSKNANCKYISEEGEEILIEAKGFLARVIQHEIDHLDGILTIDRERIQSKKR
ncbi:MAG: peptide deformylase [Patescibacteria group bacterium]|jgi:peptide deformylase|nr:peptide deformylase [Patescibacteria group bacterium]